MKIIRWLLPITVSAFLSGCSGGSGSFFSLGTLKDLLLEQVAGLGWILVKWTLLGGMAGLAVAIGGYFLLKRLGAYDWQWRHARWFRWLTLAVMIPSCPVLGASVGFFQGVLRGAEYVLREGPLATRVFPVVGNAGAEILLCIHVVVRKLPDAASRLELPELPKEELESFRNGRLELNVTELRGSVESAAHRSTDQFLASLHDRILEQYPALKGGLGEKALNLMITEVGRRFLVQKAQTQLTRVGLGYGAEGFFRDLAALAARQGDPNTVSRQELAAFFVEKVVVGGALLQVRAHVRSQQFLLLGIGAAVILIPVLVFRVAEQVRRRYRGRGQLPTSSS